MAVSIVLTMLGLGGFCALLFNFAVYALPATIGLLLVTLAINTGAGAIVGTIVGAISSAIAFTLGNVVFVSSRSLALRWLVSLPFVAFAAYAGYSIVLKLSELNLACIRRSGARSSQLLAPGSLAAQRFRGSQNCEMLRL
jgi:hypothetical protein